MEYNMKLNIPFDDNKELLVNYLSSRNKTNLNKSLITLPKKI